MPTNNDFNVGDKVCLADPKKYIHSSPREPMNEATKDLYGQKILPARIVGFLPNLSVARLQTAIGGFHYWNTGDLKLVAKAPHKLEIVRK